MQRAKGGRFIAMARGAFRTIPRAETRKIPQLQILDSDIPLRSVRQVPDAISPNGGGPHRTTRLRPEI